MTLQSLVLVLAAGLGAAAVHVAPAAASSTLWSVLGASGPRAEVQRRTALYDRLIGDWDVEVVDFDLGDAPRTSRGEWHFAWVLEGRGIQDVLIVPGLGARDGDVQPGNRYGTSVRTYDARSDSWQVTWINPVSGAFNRLVGRAAGGDIVQEGRDDSGARIRWTFSEITATSFRWRGEVSTDDGATWRLQAEFHGRRPY